MPKRLSEVRSHPPAVFTGMGDAEEAERQIAINAVELAFETSTGVKTRLGARLKGGISKEPRFPNTGVKTHHNG